MYKGSCNLFFKLQANKLNIVINFLINFIMNIRIHFVQVIILFINLIHYLIYDLKKNLTF